MTEAELRSLVRDVLREVLASRGRAAPAGGPRTEAVRIASDVDLAAFVARLAKLMEDPAAAEAIRAGRHRFTLEPAPAARPAAGETTVLRGAVTEAKINRCAGAGVVVLAADAVLTPLARDRARALGLKIERRR